MADRLLLPKPKDAFATATRVVRLAAKNGSATATITMEPERLAHICVEQALLYPWMCFTSWFELHRSQDERFSAPSSLEVTDLFAVSDRGVSVMIAVAL